MKYQAFKGEKVFHVFNVSQSLPRSLWTTGFVVLCLIFFLCETGMDSRFQWRLLFHCFQGLFLRSHRGFCDECPRQGVFSEHTSEQLLRRSQSHLSTAAWLSWGCGVTGRLRFRFPIGSWQKPSFWTWRWTKSQGRAYFNVLALLEAHRPGTAQ
jgi:hypothetical protein